MNLIAVANDNWGIGWEGRLLVRIPAERKSFETMTAGQIVVMGRRTFVNQYQSLAQPGKINLVLTSSPAFTARNVTVVHSVEEVLSRAEKEAEREIYVIGGESVFREFLPYCSVAHIAKIHHHFDADAYMPDLDQDPAWEITETSDEQTYFDLEYHFLKYERISGSV